MISKWEMISVSVAVVVSLIVAAGAHALELRPLENAYWRFEEGTNGNLVGQSSPYAETGTVLDTSDSSIPNHMRAWADPNAPVYTIDVPASIVPGTSAANSLALSFAGTASGGQDIYTATLLDENYNVIVDKPINNPIVTNFTLEASFKVAALGRTMTIVSKESKADDTTSDYPPLALKIIGPEENFWTQGRLSIQLRDKSNTLREINSLAVIEPAQWYHAVVIGTATELKLYLGKNGEVGLLQGTTSIAGGGPLYQGVDGSDPDTEPDGYETVWNIGKGMKSRTPTPEDPAVMTIAHWFNGVIDEVRLSKTVVSPCSFLFLRPQPEIGQDVGQEVLVPGMTTVTVRKVESSASAVHVYDISTVPPTLLGSNNSPGGNSTVTVTVPALSAGQTIAATQVLCGAEGPIPADGPVVGDCAQVPVAWMGWGPLYAGQTQLTVYTADPFAQNVRVYANGSQIGINNAPGGASEVTVNVPALVEGDEIKATQTISGLEGCLSTAPAYIVVPACRRVAEVGLGMVDAGRTLVAVTGVDAAAQNVKVYANDIQIGVNNAPGGLSKVMVTVPALVQGDWIKATQTVAGQESCLPVDGRRVTPTGIIEDFESTNLAANHPSPGESYVWYDITHETYGFPQFGELFGSPDMNIRDGGYQNGLYAVYDAVIPTDGLYHLEVDMLVNEADPLANPGAILTYQVGVTVNGAHRPADGDLADDFDAKGDYLNLTPQQDGVGIESQAQRVYSTAFNALAGDDLLISFSTILNGTYSTSTAWATDGSTNGAYMMVDNIKLVPGLPVCLPSMVPVVTIGGPLETGATRVRVLNIQTDTLTTTRAKKVTVYRYTPSPDTWTKLGEVDPQGVSEVLVNLTEIDPETGQAYKLEAHWAIAATQTVALTTCDPAGDVEGVKSKTGVIVGTGKNTPMRLSIGIRETASSPCTIGEDGGTTGTIEWLGAATKIGSAPQGKLLGPSSEWQTVTFTPGSDPLLAFTGNGVLDGTCGVLEHLALSATAGTPNSGRYVLYIDNVKSGSASVAHFEDGTDGLLYMFNYPSRGSTSGSTNPYLLSDPDQTEVVPVPVEHPLPDSTKALRVQFQFKGEVDNQWVRLSTVPAATPQPKANPIVDLTQPITMEILFLGVTCNNPFADADGDSDVDQADFAAFQSCYTGVGGTYASGCDCFDRDNDNDIDPDDLGKFEKCASGPGFVADSACDN